MTWCPADDAQICEDCGALIADGYQQIHRRMHPHPYDHDPYHDYATEPARHDCVMCRLPEDAPVHQDGADPAPQESVPGNADALRDLARLADYVHANFPDEAAKGGGTIVDVTIRLLNRILLGRDAAEMKAKLDFILGAKSEPAEDEQGQER